MWGVREKQGVQRQLTSSKGPDRMGNSYMNKGLPFQVSVEASETRGTTALVYCLINSSLYTETVQGWWSTPPTGLTVGRGEVHPNWLTVSRGVGSSTQGSPRSLASAGRRRGRRSNLLGGVR